MSEYPVYDILIHNGYIVTMDPVGTRLKGADLAIRDGRIIAIGRGLEHSARRILDARGNAVLPGLVNCHMHETVERGLVEDMPLMRWLEEICFPIDTAFQPSHQRAAALMSQLEMIRGGTTTFIDIYRHPHEAALVAEQSGLRAIFSPQVIDDPVEGPGETLESNIRFVEEWGQRVPGRIFTWFGPHAPYSVKTETYRKMARLAEKYETGIHTHLCEVTSEVEDCLKKHGKTPVEYLDGLGVLGVKNFLGAHGVYLNNKDMQILHKRGASIAHNPSSNMKMAAGVSPVPDLIQAGVRVGLGTDSNLSNNNLDMFEEMRLAGMLQKVTRMDPEVMPVEHLLRMATNISAECLGLGDQVGSLEVGKKADIILIDLHAPHMWPISPEPSSNIYEQIVYSANAGDVITTIVDGKVLMLDREVFTLDEGEAETAIHEAVVDLLKRAGISR